MNHKRKRPKNRRAGCLFCKPHKMNGWGKHHCDSESGRRDYWARQQLAQYFKGAA
jgi:hypothetical protein